MKLYFATVPTFIEELENNNVRHILLSYYHANDRDRQPSKRTKILLDSGGFTARIKGVDIDVKEYAKYINRKKIKLAFNLDTNDVQETKDNQKYLEKHTNCYIIPIYHLSDFIDKELKLEELLDYPYIAIGGVAGVHGGKENEARLYNYVFKRTTDKIKVHGLGITSKKMLERYPWYSVDSTSWSSFMRYGRSLVHSKEMSLMKLKTKHYKTNIAQEVEHWLSIERYVTRLWESRGVKW